ncbi:MAG: S1C family serine protease, partial [Actinomycetota bacterium]
MRTRVVVLLACSSLVLASCSLEPILDEDDAAAPSPTPTVHLDQSDRPPPPSELADVVDEVLPSVVNVRVRTAAGRGQGSGVIIEPDGVILTNAHVVSNAEDVQVVFNDGVHDTMPGEIVGAVPDRDLAVLRVDADDLTPIEIGRSSLLRLGDPVIAVGFPLGLGATVTQGIISGEERTISTGEEGPPLRDLLQTDAAINPGNSGGALVNLSGELVGINTATASAAFAENTGFAISIDSAVPFIEQILSGREQGFLGVTLASVASAAAAEELGFDEDVRGALIASDDPEQPAVIPDSAADRAGLEEGMVITAVNGVDVGSAQDVIEIVTQMQPGDGIELE